MEVEHRPDNRETVLVRLAMEVQHSLPDNRETVLVPPKVLYLKSYSLSELQLKRVCVLLNPVFSPPPGPTLKLVLSPSPGPTLKLVPSPTKPSKS